MPTVITPYDTSPSINYEDYDLPCFLLNSGNAATNFIRSQFDYSVRQRRAVRGYDSFNVRIILEYYQTIDFQEFWSDLNYGNDKFYTNQPINDDTTYNKIVRFKSGYNISQIGGQKFEVTVPIELIQTGTAFDEFCPLEPAPILIVKDGLEPC